MENKHTISDLYQMQSLPLSAKIRMTENRIMAWVEEYGVDGVYVSFSGGKDSTVLLDIVRKLYPSVKAVFVDTGLEYPSVRKFAESKDNVTTLKQISLVDLEDICKRIVNGLANGFKVLGEAFTNVGNSLEVK